MISAKVIADTSYRDLASVYRVTTLELVYPRFIHAEIMTHRALSRNASSSRAIPIERMIQTVEDNMAMPIHWGQNQSGMQADNELDIATKIEAQSVWIEAAKDAIKHSKRLAFMGAHKQIANRITEPFQHIRVLVTATEWDNFFELRDHKDAQPEIQELARAMRRALNESKPRDYNAATPPADLNKARWHLPYISEEELNTYDLKPLTKVSSARCARLSYQNFEGKPSTVEQDLKLFDKLTTKPLHASALEHVCQVGTREDFAPTNFRGFTQLRRFVEEGEHASI